MTEDLSPGIAVLIPTFNRRASLERAIESVLQETRIPIQAHIFDNASSDDTQNYARNLETIDPRVKYVRRATNIGAHENYEQALAAAASRYFIPLADDDLVTPGFLFDAYNLLERHDEVGAVIYMAELRDKDGALFATHPSAPDKIRCGLLSPEEHLSDWMTYGHYHWSAMLWRTAALRALEPPYLRVGMPSDVDLQARFIARWPCYVVNEIGGVNVMHEGQVGWRHDETQISNWSRLIQSLDRDVAELRLFSPSRYETLRTKMLERYRNLWRRKSDAILGADELFQLAKTVGYVLHDWPCAFDLLDRGDALLKDDHSGSKDGLASHPNGDGDLWRSSDAGSSDALVGLRWLKTMHRETARLASEVDALRGVQKATMAELASARNSAATLVLDLQAAQESVRVARSSATRMELRVAKADAEIADLAREASRLAAMGGAEEEASSMGLLSRLLGRGGRKRLEHVGGEGEPSPASGQGTTLGGSKDARQNPVLDSFFIPNAHFGSAPHDAPFMLYNTCSTGDFFHPEFLDICHMLDMQPNFHRKLWEFCFIVHHLERQGALSAGSRGLGFGVGAEPLTSLFAKRQVSVLATDAPKHVGVASGWRQENQHSSSINELFKSNVVDEESFRRNVAFDECDMRAIKEEYYGFDFCWSACCLEHLGSLESGFSFITNSVEKTLQIGGIACHTTEFNLSSNDDTMESGDTVIYRRRDIEGFISDMRRRGHHVESFRLAPDSHWMDHYVDAPPYRRNPHLRLKLGEYVSTSLGLVITRGV